MELVQVDAAAADWDKNRPAVVEAEAPRFLLSRKATAAALVSDRRDEEAADEDDAPTDRNVAALKAVATRVAVSAKKAILASLWKCIVIRVLFQWDCNEFYDINVFTTVSTHQLIRRRTKMMMSSSQEIQLVAGCNNAEMSVEDLRWWGSCSRQIRRRVMREGVNRLQVDSTHKQIKILLHKMLQPYHTLQHFSN
jgi:hypothetical protein